LFLLDTRTKSLSAETWDQMLTTLHQLTGAGVRVGVRRLMRLTAYGAAANTDARMQKLISDGQIEEVQPDDIVMASLSVLVGAESLAGSGLRDRGVKTQSLVVLGDSVAPTWRTRRRIRGMIATPITRIRMVDDDGLHRACARAAKVGRRRRDRHARR
jgi:hypothetical protein